MTDPQPVQPGSARPRISLLTSMLLMTIVALAVVLILLWREISPLRAEVSRLRDETGVLVVDDPTKVHAIQVKTRDELMWKWRVWIPEGHVYVVRASGDAILKEGYPKDGGSMWIRAPGEYVVGYQIDRDPTNGKWYGKTTLDSTGSVGKDEQPWVTWKSFTSTDGGVSKSLKTFEPGSRIDLIRHRVSQARTSTQIEDPSAGFIIWLEPGK